MLQEVLSQELVALEMGLIECEESGEIVAGGVGCRGSACSGACTNKPSGEEQDSLTEKQDTI